MFKYLLLNNDDDKKTCVIGWGIFNLKNVWIWKVRVSRPIPR